MEVSRTSELAAERALFLPELLDIIFGMLDRRSNARNARVCKRWSAIALDVLWSEVDPRRLFSLLAPLKVGNPSTGELEFEKIPDLDCWKNFDRYSFRVRELILGRSGLTPNALDIVARTRPRQDILPNMHTLVWNDMTVDPAIIFMHSGVKTFQIRFPSSVSPFLREIALRMPDLSNLVIDLEEPDDRQHEADLIYLVTQLSKLLTISFPRYYATTNVMEALSRLPNLGAVDFQSHFLCDKKDYVTSFTPRMDDGAFPTLYDLSFWMTLDEMSQLLDHNFKFSSKRLTSLRIDSDIIETCESMYVFLCDLAENCPLLQYLYLTFDYDCFDMDPSEIVPFNIPTDQLKPLFKLSNLKSLEIQHYFPLALKMEDIDLFATSWRSLEILLLNTEPVQLQQSSELTLEALLPFANHCPNLVRLGLFVDASCSKIPPPQLIPPLTRFKRLKSLTTGVSNIDDGQSAALYLSHILPSGCQVDSKGAIMRQWQRPDNDYQLSSKRKTLWMKVSELLEKEAKEEK